MIDVEYSCPGGVIPGGKEGLFLPERWDFLLVYKGFRNRRSPPVSISKPGNTVLGLFHLSARKHLSDHKVENVQHCQLPPCRAHGGQHSQHSWSTMCRMSTPRTTTIGCTNGWPLCAAWPYH